MEKSLTLALSPTDLSMLFPECNLDAVEETYNQDPTLSIHPKKKYLFTPVCCLQCRGGYLSEISVFLLNKATV
jgi:hypothetical protein